MNVHSHLSEADKAELRAAAKAVQVNAYAPYSRFPVGAAVRAASGKVYVGVNVENASYPVGCCAERSAIAAAITAGERELVAVHVVTIAARAVYPCGMCAQALREHGPDMLVIAEGADEDPQEVPLKQILPYAYAGEGLPGNPTPERLP